MRNIVKVFLKIYPLKFEKILPWSFRGNEILKFNNSKSRVTCFSSNQNKMRNFSKNTCENLIQFCQVTHRFKKEMINCLRTNMSQVSSNNENCYFKKGHILKCYQIILVMLTSILLATFADYSFSLSSWASEKT